MSNWAVLNAASAAVFNAGTCRSERKRAPAPSGRRKWTATIILLPVVIREYRRAEAVHD